MTETVQDSKAESLAGARAAVESLRGLAEQARGGRLVESALLDVAGELETHLNAVEAAIDPNKGDVSAVQSFLADLSTALETVKSSHSG